MFGYIIVNKPELKFKEFDKYRSFYCGLCKELKSSGGNFSRLSLSYDMTFVYILLTGLYEPKTKYEKANCIFHPINKPYISKNKFAKYVSDMSVLMTYLKCKDDWNDDSKIRAKLMMSILSDKNKRIKLKYKKKVELILKHMEYLYIGEKNNSNNIDEMSGYFGKIMGEMFVYKNDQWEPILRKMGFYLGKFIYLIDAYEDIEDDLKSNNYNPLKELYNRDDFEQQASNILLMMMAECSKEFEKLPILKNAELLRNILYSGVWIKYENIKKSRVTGGKNARSI